MKFSNRMSSIFRKYPILKGMMAYSVLWPTGSLLQQTIAGDEHYDFKKAARFALFGTFFDASSLYGWIRLSTAMWPQTNLRIGLMKAIVEQFSYGPAASGCFLLAMPLLEGKSTTEAAEEIKEKFLPTWRVGVCFWPIVQTINYAIIPERNRVPCVGVCGLLWTVFLAYMHQLESKRKQEELQ